MNINSPPYEPPSSSNLRNEAEPFVPAARRVQNPNTTNAGVSSNNNTHQGGGGAPVAAPVTATPLAAAVPVQESASTTNNGRPAGRGGGRGARGAKKNDDGPVVEGGNGGGAAAQSSPPRTSQRPVASGQHPAATSTPAENQSNKGRQGGKRGGGEEVEGTNRRTNTRQQHTDPNVTAARSRRENGGEARRGGRQQQGATEGTSTRPARGGRGRNPPPNQMMGDRNSTMTRDSKSSRTSAGPCPYNDNTPIPDINPASVLGSSRFSELSKSMSEQLICGQYDCASCLDVIKHQPAVWSCKKCYRIFHLYCIKQWAKTEESGAGKSFRCPFCQHTSEKAESYYCFCGKVRDPKYDPGAIPHSCGDTCCAKRGDTCPHPCPAPCHPGPCPPCSVQIQKPCACGKSTYSYGCDKPDPHTTCGNVCGKTLNCQKHTCTRTCHTGPCQPCDQTAMVPCTCGKESTETLCGSPPHQCEAVCNKTQRCGVHNCTVVCHAGGCPPCDSDPAMVDSCPCGKQPLLTPRTKCTDPIPLCGNVCNKALMCGHHSCERECHFGACGKCDKRVMAKCLCGQVQQKVDCTERDHLRCVKVCKTRMSCGKHECLTTCCPGRGKPSIAEHVCTRICGKQLPCGHPCPDICHPGSCAPCTNVITHELRCRCGTEVLIPPLPCSTLPPPCNKPCQLQRPCGHSDHHKCHYGECPPCHHLVNMMCVGGHTEVKSVTCGSKNVSCGRACKKPLPCGHECARRCHGGPCLEAATSTSQADRCTRICGKEIPECGHFCEKKCHSHVEGSVCRCTSKVSIECPCGLRKKSVSCAEHSAMLAKAIEELRKKKATEAQEKKAAQEDGAGDNHATDGDPIDDALDVSSIALIECDDDCRRQNMLNFLAERGKFYTGPRRVVYSLELHEAARSSFDTITLLEKKIQTFLDSKDDSLLLQAMKADKRATVHELAQFYNLKTHSVDSEPNRSVVLTKTLNSSAPTPLLSTAVFSSRSDENPEKLILKTLSFARETNLRVLAFAGNELSARKIMGHLTNQHGRFVLINSVEAEDIVGDAMVEAIRDMVDLNVIFAVFLTNKDLENAFHNLRAKGKCGFVYQRMNIVGSTNEPREGGEMDLSEADDFAAAAASSQPQRGKQPYKQSAWSSVAGGSNKAKKNNAPSGPSGGTFGFEVLRRK